MTKSISQYWNTLSSEHQLMWQSADGLDGMVENLTISIDQSNGDYTRLTRFKPGSDTSISGPKSHNYPEEIFIISGSLYDAAFDVWLKAGDYASRPPFESHGPFHTKDGCLVLEVSFPSKSTKLNNYSI